MPIARVRDGELTIPLTDEIREKLEIRDGDELDAHVFKGSVTFTPASAAMRKQAWTRIFSAIDQVQVRPGEPAMPIADVEQMIVDEVKAVRRTQRRRQHG